MKHIKTPVKVDEWGDIVAGGELLATGHGPQRVQQMKVIATALNEYDDLLAQRSTWITTCRDAIAEIAIMDVSSLPQYDRDHYRKAIGILSAAISKLYKEKTDEV
jgi:hypothetical protein